MTDFPTVPADAPNGYTLEQAFVDAGQEVPARVRCPVCQGLQQPFAIIYSVDVPDDLIEGEWACSRCRLNAGRALAVEEPAGLGLDDLRGERTRLLTLCDWTQFPDVPEATRTAWREYREALRDAPALAAAQLAGGTIERLEDFEFPAPPA